MIFDLPPHSDPAICMGVRRLEETDVNQDSGMSVEGALNLKTPEDGSPRLKKLQAEPMRGMSALKDLLGTR